MDIKHNSKTKYFKSGVVEREIIIHCHLKGANIPDHCVADMDFEAGDVYRLEYNGISNEVTSAEKDGAIHITDGTVDVYTKDTQLYVVSADESKLPHEVKLVAEEKFNEGGVEWEDIENPPFGTKVETVEILAEQTVELFVDNPSQPEITVYFGEVTFTINENQKYNVILDGVKYDCVPNFIAENGAKGIILLDTDEFFVAVTQIVDEGEFFIVQSYTGKTSVTLSISTEQEVVTHIPQKYLSEPVIFTMNDDETITCNKTYEECLTMFTNGCLVGYFKLGIQLGGSEMVNIDDTGLGFLFKICTRSGGVWSFEYIYLIYNSDGTIVPD